MTRKKRSFTTFNLSFLDIMSCGFGAVILVYLIIDHSIEVESQVRTQDLQAEVTLLEEDVTDGQRNMVRLRNALSDTDLRIVEAQGLASRITEDIENYRSRVETLNEDGASNRSEIEALQAEILALEEEVKKLRESATPEQGQSARSFLGEGSRQYLTGLNLGGRNIVILLDASASMLADRLVNIIRLRNMDEQTRRSAQKWRQAVKTTEWVTAALPPGSQYQVLVFNTETKALLPGTERQWLSTADKDQLESLTEELNRLVPAGGTNLEAAFSALRNLTPAPDNVFLITDGLPTQGSRPPRGNTIDGRGRMQLFEAAVRVLPSRLPINTILLSMEGDPLAAAAFWQLATATKGAMLSPSADWP